MKRPASGSFGGKLWEVDEFPGSNAGLIMAEIEVEREGEEVSLPEWVTQEVTDDRRYYNAYLSAHPFQEW